MEKVPKKTSKIKGFRDSDPDGKIVDNVDKNLGLPKTLEKAAKKYPHFSSYIISLKNVDNVENYSETMRSAILTTSPAPMVINKSPLIQFLYK